MKNKISFYEIEQLHKNKYGYAVEINTTSIKTLNFILAVVVPIVYPVPVALFLNKLMSNSLIFRFTNKPKFMRNKKQKIKW